MIRPRPLVHLATLLAAGTALVAVSCAGPSAPKDPQRTTLPPTTPDREEILKLESEMRQWRVELGLKPTPVSALATNGAVTEVCEGLTECKDSCKLAEAICQNKDRICDIASRLDDDWASNKCQAAKRSCSEAKEVCECCQKRERNGLLPAQPCAP